MLTPQCEVSGCPEPSVHHLPLGDFYPDPSGPQFGLQKLLHRLCVRHYEDYVAWRASLV